MKKVKLTQGFYTLVDDEDFERVTKYKWNAGVVRSQTRYAQRTSRSDGKEKVIYLHRYILDAPKDKQVDHINGNGLDNQKANLRLCTVRENQKNRHQHRNGKAVGVTLIKGGYYKAQTSINGKRVYIGIRKTQEEAIKLYEEFIKNK